MARLAWMCVAAALGMSSTPALARAPVACQPVLSGYLTRTAPGPVGALEVMGTLVSSRSSFGFVAFTMRDGFQVESLPLHLPESRDWKSFPVVRYGDVFLGTFSLVFTDRGNGDEDRAQLWMSASEGSFYVRSITWNLPWQPLQGALCFAGPNDQFYVTGHTETSGTVTDFWSFVLKPSAP